MDSRDERKDHLAEAITPVVKALLSHPFPHTCRLLQTKPTPFVTTKSVLTLPVPELQDQKTMFLYLASGQCYEIISYTCAISAVNHVTLGPTNPEFVILQKEFCDFY